MNQTLSLEAADLHRYYQVGRGPFKRPATLKAVAGASFTLAPGKTLAVVGESGCGKSTLARLITMIELPTSGRLSIDGQEVTGAAPDTLRSLRPKVQMVFQDPYGSLNPRKQVGAILEEPLDINTPMSADERRRGVAGPDEDGCPARQAGLGGGLGRHVAGDVAGSGHNRERGPVEPKGVDHVVPPH